REAAADLTADGLAPPLVRWGAEDSIEPDVRPNEWIETLDCDGWILAVWGSDALAHAATWNEPLADEPAKFGEVLDTWTSYLERLRVRWVSEGAIVLHRRRGKRHTVRVDSVDEDAL